MAVHFCTFGSAPNYTNTVRMLLSEAEASGYFDSICGFSQEALGLNRRHLDYMARTRGFGYWTWKPLVVALTMLDSASNDIVVYADAGCGISTTPIAKRAFQEWLEIVRAHPKHRLSFQMTLSEEEYTKADVFDRLGCVGEEFTKTGQHISGTLVLMNTRENRDFVATWMKHCIEDDHRLVSDHPSRMPNPIVFREHRHDQSLYSLLIKKHGAAALPDDWLNPDMPIIALRRRGRMNLMQKCGSKISKAGRSLLRGGAGEPNLYEGPISPVFLRSLAALASS